MTTVRFLSHDDLTSLVSMEPIVDAVREGYRQRGEGASAKPRTALGSTAPSGMLTGYLAILPDSGYMGGYTYSAGFDTDDAWFVTPLFDSSTGEPIAILDGAWFNPLKTGAAGAVGIDALADPNARSLVLIGTGRQAIGQLRAATVVRDFDHIAVYSPTPAHRESFASTYNDRLEATVIATGNVDDAVTAADVVITATTATDPVFDGASLSKGTHVTAMGQYHPERREIDTETIARSIYVLDLRERARQDAGAFIHAREQGVVGMEHIHGELGDVITEAVPGRTASSDITVFDSGGTAIETVAAAGLLYERAVEEERGTMIDITPASTGMAEPPWASE